MKSFFNLCKDPNWKEFIDYHTKKIFFEGDSYIFTQGESVLGLYVVINGKIKITRNTDQDNVKLIRLASNMDIVGHRGFGGNWKYPISAQCHNDTELHFIPLSVIKTISHANPEFSYNLMMFFAEELRLSEKITEIKSVKARIAYALLYNSKIFGMNPQTGLLNYTIPRRDIANFAFTTYESVIRTLSDFNVEGYIKIDNKNILIKNNQALVNISKIDIL